MVTAKMISTRAPIVLLTSLLHDKNDVNRTEGYRLTQREWSVIDRQMISGGNKVDYCFIKLLTSNLSFFRKLGLGSTPNTFDITAD